MDLDQIVVVLVQGLNQFVDQIRVQGLLADHQIPDTDVGYGLIHTPVDTAGQLNGRIGRVGSQDFFCLCRCKGENVNVMRR